MPRPKLPVPETTGATGFRSGQHVRHPKYGEGVVFRREGAPFMVVSTVVAYTARTHSWIDDVATYQEHAVRPIDGLVNALNERGLGKARLLVTEGGGYRLDPLGVSPVV